MSAAFSAKLALARTLRTAARRSGRGGTTLPGRTLLRLDPCAIECLGHGLGSGSVLISATNGKTTTASMLSSILEHGGVSVVRNRAGSNMHWGVATALLDAGRTTGELGVLEVDEAWLAEIADALDPRLLVLCNLFRDQLDRYGELELLADRWAGVVGAHAGHSGFVLNADDPLVADLGRDRGGVLYFGVDDDSVALPALAHAADSKHCRRCGHAYAYESVYLGHLGRYRCPNCGRERPEPAVSAERVKLNGMSGSQVDVRTPAGPLTIALPLPGLYNVYNALAAVAAALSLDATLDQVRVGLEHVSASFGRVEKLHVDGKDLSILLVKNPAGANEVLRTVTLESGRLDLWFALNDKTADGRDISWIWDADFELLVGRARTLTCSGTRAEEMALRLKYAGIEAPIEIDRDLARSLDSALASSDGGPLYALPTYTALLELRDILAARGLAARWSD
jgi:lipid II isoglutaminyl synthase (glutamine-hydrolysing)